MTSHTSIMQKKIWTIGHSTRSFEEFVSLLKAYNIQLLVDVRGLPGSNKFPHFNKENLQEELPKEKIDYTHLLSLGGRRKVSKDSKNTSWRNASFRGYADYMESNEFRIGIEELKELATNKNTAIMCAEAVWWRCHRSMIADQLKSEGWTVIHILSATKSELHPYTAPAKIINGKLSYTE